MRYSPAATAEMPDVTLVPMLEAESRKIFQGPTWNFLCVDAELQSAGDFVATYVGETPVIVTWHPAYLLREPSRKRETWEDIKKVNQLLGLPEVPTNQG